MDDLEGLQALRRQRRDLDDLWTRETVAAYQSGARLLNATEALHRDGGGGQMYGWLADRRAISSQIGSQQLTVAGTIGYPQFAATANGGPYTTFDGSSALYVADAAWQEATTNNLFGCAWCYLTSAANTRVIASKWSEDGDNRSWHVRFGSAVNRFLFFANQTGAVGGNVNVSDTVAPTLDAWHFVAWFWQASTLMRIFVGLATDSALRVTSLAAGVPASLFDGNAALTIGSIWQAGPAIQYGWLGRLGIQRAVVGVPAATVNGFAARLFHETKWFYQA